MAEQAILRGKVADIVSKFEIVINLGRKDGVEEGMRFRIFGKKVIIDPDSNERLGTYHYPKMEVIVDRVEEAYSVAGTPVSPAFEVTYDFENLFKGVTRPRQMVSENVKLEQEVEIGDVVVLAK